jgi:hypothetical protein
MSNLEALTVIQDKYHLGFASLHLVHSHLLLIDRVPDLNCRVHILHIQLAQVEKAGEALAVANRLIVIGCSRPTVKNAIKVVFV